MAQQWIDNALDTVARNMRAAGKQPLGYRADGRPIWPMFGAEDPPEPPTPPAPPAPEPPKPPDNGFPADTPVNQMTDAQQAAYWKFHSRKHEERVQAYGGLTPEQVKELKDKQEKLEYDLASDTEKKIADARKEAEAATEAKLFPQLATSKLEAAAAGRIDDAKLAAALAPLQASGMTYFRAADGTVDAAKVTAYIDGIAPPKPPERKGPTTNGQGNRVGGEVTGTPQERANARLERLGVKKPATT